VGNFQSALLGKIQPALTEAIDMSGPAGRMMMQMLGCFADYVERAVMRSCMSLAERRPV
jgi:DNA invertase Pin-like site-specific DNA recombinase